MAGDGVTSASTRAYPEQYVPAMFAAHRDLSKNYRAFSEHAEAESIEFNSLRLLLAQSAPQLFDRSTMSAHLELLKRLLQQAETYELNAGTDLYHQPAKLIDL